MLNVFYLVFHVIWNALRPFLISEIKCYVQLRCRKWTTATIWNDLFDVPYLNILNILRLFHISIHQSIARFIQQINENNEIIFFCFCFNLLQLETIYKKAHSSIRADPSYKKKEHKKAATKKRWNDAKLTLVQRKAKVAARKEAFIAKLKAEAEA